MATLEASSPAADRARQKIARRILPFVFVLYIISYLDRANVAFAKLSMTAELGFSEAVFGFGAGIFFIGYLFLEIPGALIVERLSARKWIARILISWGLCATLMGFIHTPFHFYAARFLLGLAEAGFFPGIIVYLTHWFTGRDRARAMAGFIVGGPVSLLFGAPISSLFLRLHRFGMSGWRWVFILEGVPAVIFGIITWFYLTDNPSDANWLNPDERQWIAGELAEELRHKQAIGPVSGVAGPQTAQCAIPGPGSVSCQCGRVCLYLLAAHHDPPCIGFFDCLFYRLDGVALPRGGGLRHRLRPDIGSCG